MELDRGRLGHGAGGGQSPAIGAGGCPHIALEVCWRVLAKKEKEKMMRGDKDKESKERKKREERSF